jgi:hypothetical protein
MTTRTIPTVPQRVLAAELKRHRAAAGLSRDDVAAALEWSTMKPWRIEEARVKVSAGDVRELAKLYGLSETDTEALVALARQARRPGWWKGMERALREGFSAHLELEATASAIRSYEAQLAPGLWQTEEYARAVLNAAIVPVTAEEVEQRVQIRMRRQQLWDREDPRAPHMWTILDEAVIRRLVGDRGVMHGQLQRILEFAARPNVTVQVLPFSAGAHTSNYGSFTLFDPQQPGWPVTASIDRPVGVLVEDDPIAIERYALIFDHLRASALSTTDSGALISEAISLL